MKQVKVDNVKGLQGKSFRIPARDDNGEVIWSDEARTKPQLKEADTRDILTVLMLNIPNGVLTRQDTIHIHRLYDQIDRNKDADIIQIEDAEWDWVVKEMQADAIGPRIFGVACYALEESLKALVVQEEIGEEKRGSKGRK